MATHEPPNARYTLTVQVTLDGITAPLSITADSVNEVKKALHLLDTNGMLAAQPTPAQATDEPPRCPVHHRPMKPSKKPGAWFCSAKVGEGSYCTEKVG